MNKPAGFSAILAFGLIAAGLTVPASAAWTPAKANAVRDGINALDADIDRADRANTISDREAAGLRTRTRSLRTDFQRLNSNGLTRLEVRGLENRTNYIRRQLKMERVDWDPQAR